MHLRSLVSILLLATLLAIPTAASAAREVAPQPPLDVKHLNYHPIGAFKPGEPIPTTAAPPPADGNGIFNPSGQWVAYDTNVYESLNLPQRQAGDESASDPPGNGGQPYGFCPPAPGHAPWGKCANHQLEYLDYYERTMKAILGDFGVVIKRYQFESPGSGPRGAFLSTAPGRSFNISATVPGADNPEETVLVSGHYDFTDSGPAAAWDSSEGHAEVIRMAKIMADYWRATGTRPSATIKFIPWDQEESGTLGSKHYVENNVPPGEEDEIRGYFNVDPCAGAFPAYYHGSGDEGSRIPMVLQLADPSGQVEERDATEIEAFNARAETIVDEVFEHLDDTITTASGARDIFVTPAEAEAEGKTADRHRVVTALGGLLAFTSDYSNFEGIGVPIFNLFPDMIGPHADGTPASAEGVSILHTPRDNLTTINALTGPDQSGITASEGWMKGMELCAQLESWYMLQPQMAGAQSVSPDPVAYYEALPNEGVVDQPVEFDAGGTYQYASMTTRTLVDADRLKFEWDFGDGTTGSGRSVKHAYESVGRYETKLTVTNRDTRQRDTMTLPVTIVLSPLLPPVLDKLPPENDGGKIDLKWTYEAPEGIEGYLVQEAEDFRFLFTDDAEGEISDKWEVSPGSGARAEWQKSNSPRPKTRGNEHVEGESSYWTGGSPTAAPVGVNEMQTMTTKEPITVTGDNPLLTYWSLFQMELDDAGRVEAAIDDGNPDTPLDFDVVDSVTGTFEPDAPDTALGKGFEFRSVPLFKYKDRKIYLRFTWALGDTEGNRVQPAGWYVDDIRMFSGAFQDIGQTTEKAFTVTDAPTGNDGYRVQAVFADGVSSAPSAPEGIRVINGGPSRRKSDAGGGFPCATAAGFEAASVRRDKRGVRFGFSRRAGASGVTVAVRRVSRGRRLLKRPKLVRRFRDKTAAFNWNGKVKGRRLPAGIYEVRFATRIGDTADIRRASLRAAGKRLRPGPRHAIAPSCDLVATFGAARPAFGGRQKRKLVARYTLGESSKVTLQLRRGKKVVRRLKSGMRAAGTRHAVRIPARKLRRGKYTLRLRAKSGTRTVTKKIKVVRL